MSDKKSIEEQITRLLRTPSAWIEPTREWIKDAVTLYEIAKTNDLPSKKISLQKIFGSNLTLKNREAVGNGLNPWAELRSARQNPAKKPVSLILEPTSGIEPETFCVLGRCDNRYTTETHEQNCSTKFLLPYVASSGKMYPDSTGNDNLGARSSHCVHLMVKVDYPHHVHQQGHPQGHL